MARPTKEGLDYFPIDIDIDQDDKLVVPIAKHGMLGLGIIVKIMMEIYRNGYFYPWGKREQAVFPTKVNVNINTVADVINDCIEWGFFNQKLFEEFGILTSAGFQKRYIEAAKRRKELTFISEYTLIDLEKACKKMSFPILEINLNGNLVNVHINPDKADGTSAESTQSKVKESKGKETKENKKGKEVTPDSPSANPDSSTLDSSSKSKSGNKRIYDEENTYYRMAIYFKGKIDEMAKAEGLEHLTAKTNIQTWADDFRKLVENDKYSDKQLIQKVMDWVVKDDFWYKNVLSASSFRDKFPRLVLDMKKNSRPNSGNGGGRNKPSNPVVEPTSTDASVSDDDFDAMMRLAEEMQASKGGKPHA